MQKIMTCLFFDGKAEEAVQHYATVFKGLKITSTSRYGDNGPLPKGTVMVMDFDIAGQTFMAMNGPPMFQFTPAISLLVNCDTQAEIDDYWDKLTAGGTALQCGWLTDKYGVSWQIVPQVISELMSSGNPKKSQNVMQALMQMTKLDIARLKHAYEQA
ncbi:MAG: VOC family protein [Pseudomonadota bacterium]